MGSDDLFAKRRKAREKRKHEFRNPKANSFLIVTEGTKTEPFYFGGIKDKIIQSVGGNIKVVEMPKIEIKGKGASTDRLIDITEEIISKSKTMYQNIWVIFDKDDFEDFDNAVELGESKGYSIGWSNQSFEYWLFLHFEYSDADLHRSEWNKKLDELFKKYGLSEDGYEKNIENLYDLLDSIGGVDTAIKHANQRMNSYHQGTDKPSDMRPGTTVHLLVQRLREYIVV